MTLLGLGMFVVADVASLFLDLRFLFCGFGFLLFALFSDNAAEVF